MKSGIMKYLCLGLLICMFGFGVGSDKGAAKFSTRGAFTLEWKTNVEISNVYTLALLKDGDLYSVVAGNGTYVVIVNASGYVESIISARDYLGINHSSIDFSFGYLGSNITHVYATVVDVSPIASIYGNGYGVDIYLFFVSSAKGTSTGVINVGKIFEMPRPIDDISSKFLIYVPEANRLLSPTLRASIGNVTGYLYSATFVSGEVVLTLVQEDLDFIEMDTSAMSITYTVGDILKELTGNELIIGLRNVSGEDYVIGFVLYESTDGSINIDNDHCVIAANITFSGDYPDVVVTDVDGDNENEVVVDNETGLGFFTATSDTYSTGYLYADGGINCGVVDRLVVGNFSGDSLPEYIFYDPNNSEIEVWNSTASVFSLKVNGTPVADIILCELDGDGYVDVFLMTETTAYFIYNGGLYDSFVLDSKPTSNGLIADIDADGYLEMIYVSNDTMVCYQTPYSKIGNTQLGDEYASRTLTLSKDTDLDRLSDWEELYVYGTSPYIADTDGDGISDWEEINIYGSSPIDPEIANSSREERGVNPVPEDSGNLVKIIDTVIGWVSSLTMIMFTVISYSLIIAAKTYTKN